MAPARSLVIRDVSTNRVLAGEAELCASPWARFRGLMLRACLPNGHAIVLTPCGSVHSAMMRFSIDVLYLDRGGTVVKATSALKPYRLSFGGSRAHTAIELPAGLLAEARVAAGDRIEVVYQDGAPAAL